MLTRLIIAATALALAAPCLAGSTALNASTTSLSASRSFTRFAKIDAIAASSPTAVPSSITAAMTVASIGPRWSAKEAMVRCHCYCAGPNATRIVSSRSNRIARGSFIASCLSRIRRTLLGIPVVGRYCVNGQRSSRHFVRRLAEAAKNLHLGM